MFFSITHHYNTKISFYFWLFFVCLVNILGRPDPSFPLEALKDDQLNQISGQAGFSMALDDLRFYFNFEQISYTDADGADYSGFDSMAGIAQGAKITLKDISTGIMDTDFLIPGQDVNRAAHFDLSQSEAINTFTPSPLCIDVTAQLPDLCWYETVHKAGILIQLPTINIFTDHFKIDEINMTNLSRGSWNNGYNFGSFDLKNINLALLSGQLAVFPGQSKGLAIAVDDLDLFLNTDELRYTDIDGLWNPINDEFDNFYLDRAPEDDEAHPACLTIKDLKIDLLRINSLVLKTPGDSNTAPTYYSPGKHDIQASLNNMHNLRSQDLPAKIIEQGGQALSIDLTSHLPNTTILYQANGGSGTVAGARILLPTQEIYIDHLSCSGIEFDDPLYPENPNDCPPLASAVINDQTSTFELKIDGAETAILSGTLEVSPK